MNDHPGGLIHDDDGRVLIEDKEREVFRFQRERLRFWKGS
jgi:hypothetical protein